MITFFLPGDGDLPHLAALAPDRAWRDFLVGERAWILQTYCRLTASGDHDLRLADRPPFGEVVIFHAKHERSLRRFAGALRKSVLVGVRADNREALSADLEVVQNAVFADGRRRFLMPHWPQPGLVPRDAARGDRVERVAFKGFLSNLRADFLGEPWRRDLARLGMEWICDATAFAGPSTDVESVDWPNYASVDVIVAVRPGDHTRATSKPPTKLVNAWLAGVPAILGPEPAFRQLRRTPLDYLEADGAPAAFEALRRLRASPELYRAMVENGRTRALEYDVAAVSRCWNGFLHGTLPEIAPRVLAGSIRRLPLAARRAARFCARLLSGRPAR